MCIHRTYAGSRRHLPPPKTNFEKLQDILKKRKGLSLDVSSSKALADSLDELAGMLGSFVVDVRGRGRTRLVRTRGRASRVIGGGGVEVGGGVIGGGDAGVSDDLTGTTRTTRLRGKRT